MWMHLGLKRTRGHWDIVQRHVTEHIGNVAKSCPGGQDSLHVREKLSG